MNSLASQIVDQRKKGEGLAKPISLFGLSNDIHTSYESSAGLSKTYTDFIRLTIDFN